ncbi:MAG: hypothetical protein F6K10_36345 [Moorea sp. SIO2B7]|nr:hypothetical protein [Moorena sp. SIO2B7]
MNIHQAQEIIYRFLLDMIKQEPPEQVLIEFKCLFVEYQPTLKNSLPRKAIFEIIFAKNKSEFINTLKRACYILINNWQTERHHQHIVSLVKIFSNLNTERQSFSLVHRRLNFWLKHFIKSPNYQNLKMFITKSESSEKKHWSERYTAYLLVSQYLDPDNPKEEREAARLLANKLKQQFKFELAMYTAHSPSTITQTGITKNPTELGKQVLYLIKIILLNQGKFGYTNLANIFLKQTQEVSYCQFKCCLQNYLILGCFEQNSVNCFRNKINSKLNNICQKYNQNTLNNNLITITCNKILEYLITEYNQKPSEMFILFMSQYNPLKLVIVLLKLILICPQSRNYLEHKIATLIKYYKDYPEEKCQWVVNFFDIFNVAFAIYADQDVEYNLIKIKRELSDNDFESTLDAYRIFSQYRGKQTEKNRKKKISCKSAII